MHGHLPSVEWWFYISHLYNVNLIILSNNIYWGASREPIQLVFHPYLWISPNTMHISLGVISYALYVCTVYYFIVLCLVCSFWVALPSIHCNSYMLFYLMPHRTQSVLLFRISSCLFVQTSFILCLRLLHNIFRCSLSHLAFFLDMLIFSITPLNSSKSILHSLNYIHKH
jgi:hypothetical protein